MRHGSTVAYRANMSAGHQDRGREPSGGLHVATIAHGGLLWDAYLEFADDPRRPRGFRGCIRFDQVGPDGAGASARTAVIIIEDSQEEAVAKVRAMDDRQLEGLLRSSLPGPEE